MHINAIFFLTIKYTNKNSFDAVRIFPEDVRRDLPSLRGMTGKVNTGFNCFLLLNLASTRKHLLIDIHVFRC